MQTAATNTPKEQKYVPKLLSRMQEQQPPLLRMPSIASEEQQAAVLPQSDKITRHANYSKLSRTMPRMPSKEENHIFKGESEQVKKSWMFLYEGEFQYSWAQDDSELVVQVRVPDEAPGTNEEYSSLFVSIWDGTNSKTHWDFNFNWNNSTIKLPNNVLAAVAPVLHRFFRRHATNLLLVHRTRLFQYLEELYGGRNLYSYLVDISLVLADAGLLTDPKYPHFMLSDVWKALRAKGRFRDAAGVRQDIAHGMAKGTLSNISPSQPIGASIRDMLHIAATDYRLDEEYQLAEACFVEALWWDVNSASSWNINEERTKSLLGDLMSLMQESMFRDGDEAFTGMIQCCIPFMGLLRTAGYTKTEDDLVFVELGECCEKVLKQQVAANAVKYLRDLVVPKKKKGGKKKKGNKPPAPADASEFRAKLRGYLKPNYRETDFRALKPSHLVITSERYEQLKKEQKKLARDMLSTGNLRGSCSNPGCGVFCKANDLRYCPCQLVTYCKKECQVAHWKVHKKECGDRAKRKGEK